jgi:hypothetical protein
VATPFPPPSEGAVAQYSVRVYLYIFFWLTHRILVVIVFGVVVPIRIVGLALGLKLVEVRVVVRERKLGGFRESGGVFFGRNFEGEVGVGHAQRVMQKLIYRKIFFHLLVIFFLIIFLDKP